MYTPIYSMLFKTHRDSELRNGGLYPCFCPARYGEGERGGDSPFPLEQKKGVSETKHRTRDGFRPVLRAARGPRVRIQELRPLYATNGNVSNK